MMQENKIWFKSRYMITKLFNNVIGFLTKRFYSYASNENNS